MKIGILGTGDVGRTLAGALARRGHDVMAGTRDVRRKLGERPTDTDESSYRDWLAAHKAVRLGTFAEAARHGELLVNATAGHASLEALATARPADLADKILIDVANALGPWNDGGEMELFVVNTDSLSERIQRAHPRLLVVKALNTVSARVMAEPAALAGGDHDVFLAGDDAAARETVSRFLREEFGWKTVIDLGSLAAARGLEMMIMVWLKIWAALGTADFNFKIVR
ncbi:MAG TPA: NAD(P)-binding domain-containing protein [Candidatus Aminicenantes bacterium]|nr:NAD(P)-binding domain-containing protein [Candidatus Aminicenantes bacterium]HRY65174.1 NAD(P)-binding domain-containing protein [Candidatus Aminicenantes bacterium]HRZ72358.1 NAD(P)-binding domain-containing protein [Candidatus Aminicenantes bacterium]